MAAMMAIDSRPASGRTVVIIEEERAIGDLMRTYLERAGNTVEIAETGKRGIELILRINPHVVLLDLTLPTMTGWEVLRSLRLRSTVPVTAVADWAGEADLLRSFEDGADDYVVKALFAPGRSCWTGCGELNIPAAIAMGAIQANSHVPPIQAPCRIHLTVLA